MDISGEKPGRKLGYILHALLEEVLEDPTLNTEEYMDKRVADLLKLSEEELKKLGEAGKERQKAEEEEAIKEIERSHKVA